MKIPEPVLLVTVGADVQMQYVAVLTVGWSAEGEAWVLEWEMIEGDPRDPALLSALVQTLHAIRFEHSAGAVPVHLAAIDSGYLADDVYRAVRLGNSLPGRTGAKWCFATKGVGGREGEPIVLSIIDKRDQMGRRWMRPLLINADTAKAELMAMLQTKEPGRGFVHIPKRAGADFVKQLTSEEQRARFDPDGVVVGHEWRKRSTDARNEGLDTMVMNLALFHYCRKQQWLALMVDRFGAMDGVDRFRALYPGEAIFGVDRSPVGVDLGTGAPGGPSFRARGGRGWLGRGRGGERC